MPTAKKAYSFTLNNYSEDEYSNLERNFSDEAVYAIIGKEIGESGTPHLQGYVLFKKSYRFETVKHRFFPRAHIEVSAGSVDDNRRYCSKDGDFREFGTKPATKRTRDELAVQFREYVSGSGSGLANFANENPGVFYFSGHNMLRNHLACQPTIVRPDISVRWIHGQPGVGKSRKAHEEMPDAYVKDPRTKWWSGYMLEKEVIIDDFGPNGIDINHLLRWFDRYKCLVESKGGMIPLYADKFIVTSNFHPFDVFKNEKYPDEEHPQMSALMRRIEVIEM